jgi:two-component system sensor histidine kinase TrcS
MVVASLADNARTHGASGVKVECSLQPRIAAQVEVGHRPEAAVYFTVTDNGPGIDPEFLPRVFEKFEKSSESSGTGLGLYLAHLMVEAMEGSLGVTSSPTGTIFQIALPMVPAPEMAGIR